VVWRNIPVSQCHLVHTQDGSRGANASSLNKREHGHGNMQLGTHTRLPDERADREDAIREAIALNQTVEKISAPVASNVSTHQTLPNDTDMSELERKPRIYVPSSST
jgi:LysM repeat protein